MFQLRATGPRHRVHISIVTKILLFVLLIIAIVNAIPGESETQASRIRMAIKDDPAFKDVRVDYPRKLGLTVGGKVPSVESMTRLKSIVQLYVADPENVYWDVLVESR